MNEEKRWWESKTVVGGLITIVASVAGAYGIAVDQDTQNQLTEIIVVVATGLGGLVSIYGRIKANSAIKKG